MKIYSFWSENKIGSAFDGGEQSKYSKEQQSSNFTDNSTVALTIFPSVNLNFA